MRFPFVNAHLLDVYKKAWYLLEVVELKSSRQLPRWMLPREANSTSYVRDLGDFCRCICLQRSWSRWPGQLGSCRCRDLCFGELFMLRWWFFLLKAQPFGWIHRRPTSPWLSKGSCFEPVFQCRQVLSKSPRAVLELGIFSIEDHTWLKCSQLRIYK